MANNWHQLDLRHLAVLQAVAETGSFWNAADVLDVSQSAVSQQVAALERIVQHRLFERSRGRRGVELTEAGRLLLKHAEAVMDHVRAAEADLRAFSTGAVGQLRVGVYQSVANRILPRLVREFAQAWPSVTVQPFQSALDDELLELVRRGDLDLTFTVFPLVGGPFEAIELMRDAYCVMLPAGSPLAARPGPLRVEDLAGQDLVGYRSCRTTEILESGLRARGIETNVVFRSDDNGTVQSMVAAGIGISVAPRLAVDERDPHVVVRELYEDIPPRVIAIAYHRDRYRSPAVDAFIAIARQVSAETAAMLESPPGEPGPAAGGGGRQSAGSRPDRDVGVGAAAGAGRHRDRPGQGMTAHAPIGVKRV